MHKRIFIVAGAMAATIIGTLALAICNAPSRTRSPTPMPPLSGRVHELPFKVHFFEHPAKRMEYTGDSVADLVKQGLSPDEAKFFGKWDYWGHGITIHANHTFVYWSQTANGLLAYSQGTWRVHGNRITLHHESVSGAPLESPIVTEHEWAEFGLPR